MTDFLRSASTPNLLADFRAYCLATDRAEADAEALERRKTPSHNCFACGIEFPYGAGTPRLCHQCYTKHQNRVNLSPPALSADWRAMQVDLVNARLRGDQERTPAPGTPAERQPAPARGTVEGTP